MVDLFADTCDLSVMAELSNDIFVVFGLSELHGLVDGCLGVGNDVVKS